jgi:hypothetical protein
MIGPSPSKESRLREPEFDFAPEEWFWPSENPWSNGMMEIWIIEYGGSNVEVSQA